MSIGRTVACISLGIVLGLVAIAIVSDEKSVSVTVLEICLLIVVLLALISIEWHWKNKKWQAEKRQTPTYQLQRHPELLAAYNTLNDSLLVMADYSDEIFFDGLIVKLAAIQEEMRALADGKLVFMGTEAWRTAYERILRSPGLNRYLSVAWLRNEDYWRDAPGRHSMQLNYDLIQLGIRIERILILNDFFWPEGAILPTKPISQWIEQQFKRGIVIRLVRESQIAEEIELLCDFGIYGRRATGRLDLDDQCRTVQFTLDFTPQNVRLYKERWQRLLLFSVLFRELLDRRAQGR